MVSVVLDTLSTLYTPPPQESAGPADEVPTHSHCIAYLINNIYTLVGFSQSLSVFVSESAMTALILNTTFTRDPA